MGRKIAVLGEAPITRRALVEVIEQVIGQGDTLLLVVEDAADPTSATLSAHAWARGMAVGYDVVGTSDALGGPDPHGVLSGADALFQARNVTRVAVRAADDVIIVGHEGAEQALTAYGHCVDLGKSYTLLEGASSAPIDASATTRSAKAPPEPDPGPPWGTTSPAQEEAFTALVQDGQTYTDPVREPVTGAVAVAAMEEVLNWLADAVAARLRDRA